MPSSMNPQLMYPPQIHLPKELQQLMYAIHARMVEICRLESPSGPPITPPNCMLVFGNLIDETQLLG